MVTTHSPLLLNSYYYNGTVVRCMIKKKYIVTKGIHFYVEESSRRISGAQDVLGVMAIQLHSVTSAAH